MSNSTKTHPFHFNAEFGLLVVMILISFVLLGGNNFVGPTSLIPALSMRSMPAESVTGAAVSSATLGTVAYWVLVVILAALIIFLSYLLLRRKAKPVPALSSQKKGSKTKSSVQNKRQKK